jgi:hypothetical protein
VSLPPGIAASFVLLDACTDMQNYDTPSPVTAVIDIPAGRVQLIAAARNDTTVEVRPANPASSRDAKMAEQVTAEYAGGTLRVTAPAGGRILGPSGSVEVTVQLPAGSAAEAKLASGEFRTVGRLGDVTFSGQQGAVKVDEAASARLSVLDGNVIVGRLTGSADIRTSRGDITVDEASAGTIVLRTEDGTITVAAAPGISAALDAGTSYGRVHNALRNSDATPALTIKATTARGDITARSL